jgi:hypothetical protein
MCTDFTWPELGGVCSWHAAAQFNTPLTHPRRPNLPVLYYKQHTRNPLGAMRSHLHYDTAKDVWSVELKVPRHMAPVTLGFVLWNSGV